MKTSERPAGPFKLGVIANEFFDPAHGGVGGFGWAARQAARLFNEDPALGVEPVFLSRMVRPGSHAVRVHGTALLGGGGRLASARRLRAEGFDLLLMIDYRPSYRFFAAALPRTPVVVWVRDPRPPEDVRKIGTLRLPDGGRPQGIDPVDCRSLGMIAHASRLLRRPLLFATPAPSLASKIPATYGATPSKVFFLPNPVDDGQPNPFDDGAGAPEESAPRRVVFLGRLDPVKRPWLFVELAAWFPEVEFLFVGRPHFEGEGAWRPEGLPPNVRMLGHLDGPSKTEVLRSAAALVNTSIHESLSVSFLESLACATPVISCQDPEAVVSRFGYYVGRFDGNGRDALPRFAEALARLLRDREERARLGREGRAWVAATHNPARFLEAFRELRAAAGLARP